jgi:hypothetical protein
VRIAKIELPDILAEARSLASEHGVMLIGTGVAIAAGYSLIDWLSFRAEDAGGLALVSSLVGVVVTVFVQYVLTERLLADRRSAGQPAPGRRYGTLFVAQLISGLAILLAAIALILPGIYLAARWFTVTPQVVEGSDGASDSLKASWEASQPSQLAFVLAAILSILPLLPVIGVIYNAAMSDTVEESLVALVLTNVLSGVSSVLGWLLAAAAYRRAVPVHGQYGGVFA